MPFKVQLDKAIAVILAPGVCIERAVGGHQVDHALRIRRRPLPGLPNSAASAGWSWAPECLLSEAGSIKRKQSTTVSISSEADVDNPI